MDRLTKVGCLLVVLSFAALGIAEIIPLLGVFAALLAPHLFLSGLAVVVFALIRRRAMRPGAALLTTLLVTVLLGLNTRLPSIVSDAFNRNWMQISERLSGTVGQPMRIESNTQELSGRRFPHRSVAPACEEGCFVMKGFRGPALHEHWRENVLDTVLFAGFSRASGNEKAARLEVLESRTEDLLSLALAVRDERGAVLAEFKGTFRNGYPLESKDGEGDINWASGALQYLLHANYVSSVLSRAARAQVEAPLRTFLEEATSLQERNAVSTNVTLEVVTEKVYEPVWVIKGRADEGTSWSKLSFDRARHDRCTQLTRRQGPWLTFIADTSGRTKVRERGILLCEGEQLWKFDFASERDKSETWLTKFDSAGQVLYRIRFDRPASIAGFNSSVLQPSFNETADHVSFDLWDSAQSGHDRHVKRSMNVRLALPQGARRGLPSTDGN